MNKIIAGLMIYLLAIGQVFGQTATLVPNAKQTFLGTTGAPLAAGTVTMYVPNSTNKKTTWFDAYQASNNPNPITLDAAGRAVIFGQGNYRQVVKDRNGVTIWDSFTSAVGSAAPSGATGTDTAPVGTVMPYSGFSVPTNWQLAYGQAVSRATFSELKTALTIVDDTISCTSGSATLTGFASTAMIRVGSPIEGSCFTTGVTVASIVSSTSITISAMASATNTVTTTIFPWGNGDGVASFNVPDLRGRTFAGANAMGGTASSALTTTYYGSNPNPPAVTGGSQSHTQTLSELASHAHSTTDPGHAHDVRTKDTSSTGTVFVRGGTDVGATTNLATSLTTTNISVNLTGSSVPFAVVQPTVTINYIIKMTPNSTGAGGVVSVGGMFGDIICDATFLCANQTIGLATQLTGTILANLGSATMTPTAVTFTQLVDTVCGSAVGDIIYRGASSWDCLPAGTPGFVLTQGALTPSWGAAGSGSVSSVGLSLPDIFTITGSPVTLSGTLAGHLATQTANTIFAGPTTGGAFTPTFRSMVSADFPNDPILSGHPTIEGVLSTGATGTGNIVYSLTPSVSNLTVAGSFTAPSLVKNSDLVNTATTVNGQTCTLGSTCTVTAAATDMTVGSTTVSSGTTTRVLYDNAGVLGEYSVTGSGNVAMSASPTFSGTIGGTNILPATALTQASAARLLGNPSASDANVSAFTIQGLTNLPSPSATLDFIPIYDHTSGTIKNVTPGDIAGSVVAGVASVNTLTGALTLNGANGISISSSGTALTATADIATGTQFASGTTNKIIDASVAVSAALPVALTSATSTITPDLNTGFNFTLSPTQSFTMANPSNIAGKEGRSFCIKTVQFATPLTVTWGSSYQAPGGSSNASLSTASSAKDMFCFMIWSTTEIFLLASKAFAH